ncbi:unnamed protein product [Thlaspi arvense]|uniref:RING-type E3 ubiquitin transferase n=1 Tax=Thlaspi arvense TaxID=13288 RepID=A0AAU9T8Q6_THLAR|nr:unnamed protein product [Thlaspi arvense]
MPKNWEYKSRKITFNRHMEEHGTSTRQQMSSVGNRISSNGENEDKNSSVTLVDLDALHCPICCDSLTSSIFQCDNGHIACSTCCIKLRNKCPSCALPTGHIRCRAMERVIRAVIVPCPNAKLGCTKSFSYGTGLSHKKQCSFSPCSCPADNCNYTGTYKDLYSHFYIHNGERRFNYKFLFGKSVEIYFELTEFTSLVMKQQKDVYCLLFSVSES